MSMVGTSDLSEAIVGAGPSASPSQRICGPVACRFGSFVTPMHRWRAHMSVGMFLTSEWDASDLPDPAGRHTLQQFCAVAGLLRKCADSCRYVHQIFDVISARSAPK